MFLRVFKRVLVAVVALLFSVEGFGQTVWYSYRIFNTEGGEFYFNISLNDDADYIVVTVKSEGIRLSDSPTMTVKNFDNEVLKFDGEIVSSESNKGDSYIIGSYVVSATELVSMAKFEVTPEDMLFFSKGISKIRLNTLPVQHERTFKRDKIGLDLYNLYLDAVEKEDSF